MAGLYLSSSDHPVCLQIKGHCFMHQLQRAAWTLLDSSYGFTLRQLTKPMTRYHPPPHKPALLLKVTKYGLHE